MRTTADDAPNAPPRAAGVSLAVEFRVQLVRTARQQALPVAAPRMLASPDRHLAARSGDATADAVQAEGHPGEHTRADDRQHHLAGGHRHPDRSAAVPSVDDTRPGARVSDIVAWMGVGTLPLHPHIGTTAHYLRYEDPHFTEVCRLRREVGHPQNMPETRGCSVALASAEQGRSVRVAAASPASTAGLLASRTSTGH